jgi:hypothetical protein
MDDNDIKGIINNSNIGILVSNQYFDFVNIEDPVQTFMDNPIDFYSDPEVTMFSVINIRRHNYRLSDNLFGINPSQEGKFYSAVSKKNINYNIGRTNDLYFRADFILDSRIDVYERILRNSIDVLGDIGGIFEIIHLLLFLPLTYFSKKLFEYEISNHLSKFKSLLNEDEVEMDVLRKQNNLGKSQDTKKTAVFRDDYDKLLNPYLKYSGREDHPQHKLRTSDLLYSLL